MKVLVTGGSGFVGRHLVERLTRDGHDVVILSRHSGGSPVPRVTRVAGDVVEGAGLAGACAGCQAVFHLVGIIAEVGRQTFERVHAEGTRQILQAAQAAGVRRFIHMSALGTRPNAVARYHQSKWTAEQAVRASGLDWTIFRPSLIHGPDDLFTREFDRLTRFSPFLPILGPGTSLMQPVHVSDVADAFAKALVRPVAIGKTYDLCGPERLSLVAVLAALMRHLHRSRLPIHLPLPLARPIAAGLEFTFGRILQTRPPFNRDQIIMLGEDNIGDATQAANDLDWKAAGFVDSLALRRA